MSASAKTAAYAGAPVKFAPADVFTWLFSSPFQKENDFTPKSQLVPSVEDERPLFIDELSGESPALPPFVMIRDGTDGRSP